MSSEGEVDLFGDLLGPKTVVPVVKPAAIGAKSNSIDRKYMQNSRAPEPADATAQQASATQLHVSPTPSAPIPDLLESHETTTVPPRSGTMITLSRDELQELVSASVQTALDSTFTRFVKSLRYVTGMCDVTTSMCPCLYLTSLAQQHQVSASHLIYSASV